MLIAPVLVTVSGEISVSSISGSSDQSLKSIVEDQWGQLMMINNDNEYDVNQKHELEQFAWSHDTH